MSAGRGTRAAQAARATGGGRCAHAGALAAFGLGLLGNAHVAGGLARVGRLQLQAIAARLDDHAVGVAHERLEPLQRGERRAGVGPGQGVLFRREVGQRVLALLRDALPGEGVHVVRLAVRGIVRARVLGKHLPAKVTKRLREAPVAPLDLLGGVLVRELAKRGHVGVGLRVHPVGVELRLLCLGREWLLYLRLVPPRLVCLHGRRALAATHSRTGRLGGRGARFSGCRLGGGHLSGESEYRLRPRALEHLRKANLHGRCDCARCTETKGTCACTCTLFAGAPGVARSGDRAG
eukprot:scaffold29227_cov53-Phaeocystis_antarctica.AAC.1